MARVDVEDRRFDAPKGIAPIPVLPRVRRQRPLRPVLRVVRTRHGHPGLPDRPVDVRDRLAGVEHVRARAVRNSTRSRIGFTPLTLILSLQASYAAPAHPARAEPAGRPRPRADRAGPAARRAQPRRHRVPRPRDRRAAPRREGPGVEGVHPRGAARRARGARPSRRGGAGACRDADRRGTRGRRRARRLAGVIDPEIRSPIAELDMVVASSSATTGASRSASPDDRRMPRLRPHRTRRAQAAESVGGRRQRRGRARR